MWSTSSSLDAPGLSASAVWTRAYADASAWPLWNDALAAASLDEPFAVGSRARVRFRTGLRLRFTLVEVEEGRVFTDESRLPGARMGHRHELEPLPVAGGAEPAADAGPARDAETAGVRLTNTIYIRGPLARLWATILGPQAKRGLPGWQRRAAELAAAAPPAARPADVS